VLFHTYLFHWIQDTESTKVQACIFQKLEHSMGLSKNKNTIFVILIEY
jgi:hypothetical protein